jgi:hypothetical protein
MHESLGGHFLSFVAVFIWLTFRVHRNGNGSKSLSLDLMSVGVARICYRFHETLSFQCSGAALILYSGNRT